MPRKLPLSPPGLPLLSRGGAACRLRFEVFQDINCPFSGRMIKTLRDHVLPALESSDKVARGQIEFNVVSVPQPWHSQSTNEHEVLLAVNAVRPDLFKSALYAMVDAQEDFFDAKSIDKSRRQLYKELVPIALSGCASEAERADVSEKVHKLLDEKDDSRIKLHCRYHRRLGVHVTPTVFLNGEEATVVSSSWTGEQWIEFLKEYGVDA